MNETNSIVLDNAIKFALRIVELYGYLTEQKKEYVLSKLVLISGTHIAKFVNGALAGQDRQGFTADMYQAKKRAKETEFWLMLIHRAIILTKESTNRLTPIALN
jgi:four helix bundle protein